MKVEVIIDGELLVCHPPLPNEPVQEMQLFSQRDPKWSALKMGGVQQTIGSAGCALCCAAMIGSLAKPDITPGWLNSQGGIYHIVNIGMGPEAHLVWEKLPIVVQGTVWDARDKLTWKRRLTDAELLGVRERLQDGPLILYVNFYPGGAFSSHFVVGTRYLDDEQDIEIVDPWDGVKTRLLRRYARAGQGLKDAIWGIRGYYAET